MCHYPDLGSPSDWLEICFNQSEARGVTIHIPFDSIRFRLWSFNFEYFDSITQSVVPLLTRKPQCFQTND